MQRHVTAVCGLILSFALLILWSFVEILPIYYFDFTQYSEYVVVEYDKPKRRGELYFSEQKPAKYLMIVKGVSVKLAMNLDASWPTLSISALPESGKEELLVYVTWDDPCGNIYDRYQMLFERPQLRPHHEVKLRYGGGRGCEGMGKDQLLESHLYPIRLLVTDRQGTTMLDILLPVHIRKNGYSVSSGLYI